MVKQSVIASLTERETATLQTAYEALNRQLESATGTGNVGEKFFCGNDVVRAIGAPDPRRGPGSRDRFKANVQLSFAKAASGGRQPAPSSSVGSDGVRDMGNTKRPRPRLFVNTNVDAGMYIGHGPQGTDGAGAAAAAIAAARSAARAVSRTSHNPPGMGSAAAAAASAAAEAAARYAGDMGGGGNPSVPPSHRGYHSHGTEVGGAKCIAGDCPITIPGTSVRRYMHVQLLLALMSAPGLKVAASAKVSWARLGYYPVDAIFGPPAPGGLPPDPLRSSAAAELSPMSPAFTDTVAQSPPKRARVARVRGVHDSVVTSGMANTGAMAMPPSQHSPRTSAMLSGLPVGSEGAMMLGDAGDLYFSSSPTSYMSMGVMGPMSPYSLSLPAGEGGGGGIGSEGTRSGGDPSRHFDFAAAVGGISGGSQVMMPNFAEFASLYSPSPFSPTFGAGKLSPLHAAMSPQSFSPRVNWASELQGFST